MEKHDLHAFFLPIFYRIMQVHSPAFLSFNPFLFMSVGSEFCTRFLSFPHILSKECISCKYFISIWGQYCNNGDKMEKSHKIIIVGLVIVIIALVAGLAYMLTGNNLSSGNGSVPEGMKMYDFNSEFKMAVPKDVKFLKQWNKSDDMMFGQGYTYFDRNNEIQVAYSNSPMITHEFINTLVNLSNSSGNATFEFEGDLIIGHFIKNSGKISKTPEDSEFKESIILQRGHMIVGVSGNDLNLTKSMINTIEFYE